jgi:regulator of replication initiation timing
LGETARHREGEWGGELVRMETELLRLKLDAQLQENEKLRIQNRDIWERLQDIEKVSVG